jgi:Heterokaryon incompatibility protein (HET)
MTLELAAGWLQICQENHAMRMPSIDEQPTLPSRIIYIDLDESKAPYLHESKGDRGHYVALSYRWGTTQKGELKDNVYHDYRNSIPLESISMTPRGAIGITRGLGIRYLWVDALCIIQDSDVDKGKELGVMGDIYRNATVTIAAANGDHADSGLFKIRDVRAYRPCPIFKYENEDGREVQVFAAGLDHEVQNSPLDTRAWTFQEEILSTRILKFGPDSLRWPCVTLAASEKAPMGNEHSPHRLDYQMREWIHYPEAKPLWHEALDPRRRYFEDWYSVVEHYSTRDLTKPTDKLPVVSGLAEIMQRLHGCTYLAGLWKEDFEYGLLWYVCEKPEGLRAGGISQDSLYGELSYRISKAGGEASSSELEPETPENNGFLAQSMFWLNTREESLTKAHIHETPSMGDSVDNAFHIDRAPSWSWACINNARIRFLYSQHGLTAAGTSMAMGLDAVCRPKHHNQSAYGEASGGHIILKGALNWVFALPDEIARWHKDYETPSMMIGRWTAHLLSPAAVSDDPVGFAAFDNDPEHTGLVGTMVACLLLRLDDEKAMESELSTRSGWLRPGSYVPLAFNNLGDGKLSINQGRRRWVVCLLLYPVNEKTIFRRVGLCQMYHSFWADRLVF